MKSHNNTQPYLNTKVVDVGKIRIVVSEASVRSGMQRYRLMEQGALHYGVKRLGTDPMPEGVDQDEYTMRVYTYPNLIAATVSIDGLPWPMTFDQFLGIPEAVWNVWTEAVEEKNPHWFPKAEPVKAEPVSQDPKA